ncbi:DUF6496 domain-containing protein [soil metagenome]
MAAKKQATKKQVTKKKRSAKAGSRQYSKAASDTVGKAMHERKAGTLKSGRSGRTVKSKKQAIAIGLSEARREGKKVPAKKGLGGPKRKASGSRKKTTKS